MGLIIRIRTPGGEEALDLEEFEARVRRGELASHCPVNFPPVTGSDWVRADALDLFRRLHQPRQLYFSRAFNLGRFPKLTALFIILDVALYVVMSSSGPIDQDALVLWGAKVAPLIYDVGQYWRLLTANLLHKDELHIAFNLFVLFNVGGALENVYRSVDYLLILFFSALGTTVMSLAMLPDAATAGASGIVYGALGGVVVFGVKYRDLLPPRYRRILGEATIPTVLVFLSIGFTSSGVDNWAHLGGLFAGSLTTLLLEPRLLIDRAPSQGSSALRLAPVAIALLAIAGLCAASPHFPSRLQPARDDAFGIEAQVPRTWVRGMDRFGQIAFHNGLPGLGRASMTAQGQLVESGRPLDRAVDEYVKRQLVPEERAGVTVNVQPPIPATLAGYGGLLLEGTFTEEGNVSHLKAYFIPRGQLLYVLTFLWPAEYPGYEKLLAAMAQTIRLVESKELREARARVLLDPARVNLLRLGEVFGHLGHRAAAVATLSRAAEGTPDVETEARLAQALLAAGRTEEGCERAGNALAARSVALTLEAMGDCRLAKHDHRGALDYLQRASEAAPGDERLVGRLRALLRTPGE